MRNRGAIDERRRLMASEAARQAKAERDSLARSIAETVALAEKRGETTETGKDGRVRIMSRDGLAWLIHRGDLEPHQVQAADRYRRDWALSEAGLYPSALADRVDGGGSGVVSLTEVHNWARGRIDDVEREALRGLMSVIPLVRGVCGHGYTLRDLVGKDGQAAGLARLQVALDMMAIHYGMWSPPVDRRGPVS